MGYHKKARKFSLKQDGRRALLKGLAANLILHGSIKTTVARAKTVRSLVERLITKNKVASLVGVRYAAKFLPKVAVSNLVKIAPKYISRNGGYTRITRIGQRQNSDGAMIVKIELL